MKQFTISNQLTAMPKRLAMVLTVLFTLGVGQMWGESETISFSSYTATGSGTSYSLTWNGNNSCTIQQEKASSNTNVSSSYTTSPRWYSGHYITFTPKNCTITKIVITATGSSNNGQTMTFVTGKGNIENTSTTQTTITGSWTSAFKLKMGSQCRVSSVVVTYTTTNAAPYTVTLNAGPGSCAESVTEISAGAGVTLPEPTLDCSNWKFAGWATSPVEEEITEAPKFITDKPYKPSGDITLYAVYQRTETTEGGGSVTPQTDEVTISDFGTGTSTRTYPATYADWTWAKNSGSNIATYDEIRLYASHSMKISPKSGYTIESIVATCTNSSYASALAGSSLSGASKSVSGSTVTITPTSGDIVITQAAQSRVSKFTVTYSTTAGGTTTTTYYHSTPECGTPTPTPTLNVDPATLTFEKTTTNTSTQKTFTLTGSNLTANASLQLSGIDTKMFSLSSNSVTQSEGSINQTITVTYTPTATGSHKATLTISSTGAESKTVTLSGTGVAPAAKYTVTFDAGSGSCSTTSLQETSSGAGVTLPTANPPAACATDDWKFAGWWTEAVKETTTSPGELLTADSNYKPTKDCTLYAVYSHTEAGGGGSGFYLSVTKDDATTYYIGEQGSGAFLSAVTDINSAATFNIENNQYLYYANKTYVSSTSNNTSLTIETTTPTVTWAITDEGETITFKSNGTGERYLAFNYNNGSPRFSSYGSTYTYELTKHTTSTTTFNSNPTCLVPVWEGATIDKTALTVNCGERSSMDGAAQITFSKDKIFYFSNPITIEASEGFLVSTSRTPNENYQQSVSQSPLVGTEYPNTFNGKFVYVRAEAPAQSDTDLEGTITIKNNKGETLQTFSVTADVTCTQYTLTLVDRGVSTVQPGTYFAGQTIDEAPADPEGVCTDPIHYVFDGWAEATVAEGSTTYTKVTFPYTVTDNTKFYAVYRYVSDGGEPSNDFIKVTKEKDDWTGDYVIVNEDAKKAIGNAYKENTSSNKTLAAVAVTITDNKVVSPSEDIIWQIRKNGENYTMYNAAAGKYAYVTDNDSRKAGLSDNPQTMNISWGSEATTTRVYSPTYVRCFSYYGSNSEWRTYGTSNNSTGTLYCRALETYLYTTSPVCGPHLAITEGKDIYVTGGNAGAARDLVMASQKVSYQATRLKTQDGSPEGTAPDVKVATNGITKGGVVTTEVKVTFENTVKELQPDDTYTITGDIVVTYEADANNMKEDIQVQLAVDYPANADARDNFIVHTRSLPEKFVIVAKQSDKWYALNADMSSSKAQPANKQIEVDDIENPTMATFAPCNTAYTFEAMPQGAADRISVRFIGMENKYLWSASEGSTGIQNNSKNPTADVLAYNWKLYTTDNVTYQVGNGQNTRMLGLNSSLNFGMYAPVSGLVNDIRILPIDALCTYNYAPTNLKVSVLKSTSVTLTWDAVAGATKYQYSTDGNTWTDAGTEPTTTISGLTKSTDYTYYIRAYHEDAGVSQECIDYSEITFTTADCDDVPTDIACTTNLNSITVSWTASAASATVKLYSDEAGETTLQTKEGATSPCNFTGLTKNTTYYLQIFSGGICASPIIPVKTEDIKVDVVEWQPQGIVVDINTNEKVGVTLENEVSYGSGTGSEATELFFSKYYEATTNVKLVAIYNGTKNLIDLTDYQIHYGKDSWESQYITLKDFGATKGQIQPGEEIILYTMSDNDDSDKKIMDCVNGDYPDGKWVRVTQSNNEGKGHLSFAGNKTLVLKKAGTIIDIIGALDSTGKPTSKNANSKPSWGDANGWNCATGLSIADDTEIGISTNRCLLIRNNTVTSGANAVTSNIDNFVTLCSEWKGAQVPDSDVDNGVAASCENFAYVGTFDYSDYYTKFESMGEEIVFEENKRNPDGTVNVPITDLYKQSCRNIRITLEDKDGNVLSNREYKVPIMITTTQGTNGEAFIALQENLAMIETDGEGNPTGNKTNLTLEQVKEICKTCDVVIRDNATLMKMDDDAANDHPQVHDVYVYENSSLVVPNGTNYTINNLSLRRKGDEVASLNVYPGALKLPESVAAPISLDVRVDAQNWHWFTLPYNCNISEVTWIDGSPAQYNVDWFLMTYDGESRSKEQSHYENHWKQYFGTTIEAGKGYIVGITGDLDNVQHTFELRFPMAKEVLEDENKDKTVDVRAWGVEDDIRPNKKGWNLIGNPYLAYYQRDNVNSFGGLRLGELIGPDPQTGLWEQTGNLPYVVVPVEGGWVSYEQLLVSETDLLPFTAYFVQVGNDGTHNSTQELKVSFDHSKLQLSATPMPASLIQRSAEEIDEVEQPVIVGVSLSNSQGESDKTSLVIDNQYTNEYELNADFFKWFGDYYTYYTKPVLYTIGADNEKLAFNAISNELANQPIAMGMYAAKAGEYTFTLDLRSDLSKVEEVWLHDATENIYTNLLQDSYTFSTSKVNGEGRFFLSVKMKPVQEPDPDPTPDPDTDPNPDTSLDDITANQVWATVKGNVIYVNGLLSSSQVWIYDAAGKLMHHDQTKYYQHTYIVPQGGAYFVRVQSTMQTQTIKVVVK